MVGHTSNSVLGLRLALANIVRVTIEELVSALYSAPHHDSVGYHVFARTSIEGQIVYSCRVTCTHASSSGMDYCTSLVDVRVLF